MQRAVRLGCILGAALVGFPGQSEAKTIKLRCTVETNTYTITLNITADYSTNSVVAETIHRSKDSKYAQFQAHEIRKYVDGAYAKALTYRRTESRNGGAVSAPETNMEENLKSYAARQHVLIRQGRIQFGQDNSVVSIDMDAGGTITAANGKTGFCDYSN